MRRLVARWLVSASGECNGASTGEGIWDVGIAPGQRDSRGRRAFGRDGDLNGDGKPDLATANAVADSVSVLINRGDGSFQAKIDYATGRGPRRSRSAT